MRTFIVFRENSPTMEGCILPNGQCAINWVNTEIASHGCFPSWESLYNFQKGMNREIIFMPLFRDEKPYESRFKLLRIQDVGGISGTGYIAAGCEFSSGLTVLQYTTEIPTIFWYARVEHIEKIFGHNGKTVIERIK